MDCKVSKQVSALGINVLYLLLYSLDKSFFTLSLKDEIENYYKQFEKNVTPDDIVIDPHIAGYRKLHEKVGIADDSLIASPESLFKILFKYKSLRPINPIVDTYNYIAIKNKISIGAHDIDHINGDVELRLANGDELFIPLGKNKAQTIASGEYCYIDDRNEVICRLDCRQSDKTKTSAITSSCLFIIQGNEYISTGALDSTAEDLLDIFNLGITNPVRHKIILA